MSNKDLFNYKVYRVIIPLTIFWMCFLWVIDFTNPEQILGLGGECLVVHGIVHVYFNQRKTQR